MFVIIWWGAECFAVLSGAAAGMRDCRLLPSVVVHVPGLAFALDEYTLVKTLHVPCLTVRGPRASSAA